jgi:hypothetical protein
MKSLALSYKIIRNITGLATDQIRRPKCAKRTRVDDETTTVLFAILAIDQIDQVKYYYERFRHRPNLPPRSARSARGLMTG